MLLQYISSVGRTRSYARTLSNGVRACLLQFWSPSQCLRRVYLRKSSLGLEQLSEQQAAKQKLIELLSHPLWARRGCTPPQGVLHISAKPVCKVLTSYKSAMRIQTYLIGGGLLVRRRFMGSSSSSVGGRRPSLRL
jgi:hypothetical protein